jgi:hypothetical protein
LIALIGSIYLEVKCRNWHDFRSRIWIWPAATVVLAVFVTGYEASLVNSLLDH